MLSDKPIEWSADKNKWLLRERGVSFEDVIVAITDNRLLKVIRHPNTKKYPRQRMMIVEIAQYTYSVPYVEEDEYIFLKTIYPNRQYMYLLNNK